MILLEFYQLRNILDPSNARIRDPCVNTGSGMSVTGQSCFKKDFPSQNPLNTSTFSCISLSANFKSSKVKKFGKD